MGVQSKSVSMTSRPDGFPVLSPVILCSNCHRMVLTHRPWIDLYELQKLLNKSQSKRIDIK